MEEKKLTFTQICELAAAGKFDEIPEGYEIKWERYEPGSLLDCILTPDKVKLLGRHPFAPDLVKIKIDCTVSIANPDSMVFNSEPLDYCPIALHTIPAIIEFRFIYGEETWAEHSTEIVEWMGGVPQFGIEVATDGVKVRVREASPGNAGVDGSAHYIDITCRQWSIL